MVLRAQGSFVESVMNALRITRNRYTWQINERIRVCLSDKERSVNHGPDSDLFFDRFNVFSWGRLFTSA